MISTVVFFQDENKFRFYLSTHLHMTFSPTVPVLFLSSGRCPFSINHVLLIFPVLGSVSGEYGTGGSRNP